MPSHVLVNSVCVVPESASLHSMIVAVACDGTLWMKVIRADKNTQWKEISIPLPERKDSP
jgi:hypothetical protein